MLRDTVPTPSFLTERKWVSKRGVFESVHIQESLSVSQQIAHKGKHPLCPLVKPILCAKEPTLSWELWNISLVTRRTFKDYYPLKVWPEQGMMGWLPSGLRLWEYLSQARERTDGAKLPLSRLQEVKHFPRAVICWPLTTWICPTHGISIWHTEDLAGREATPVQPRQNETLPSPNSEAKILKMLQWFPASKITLILISLYLPAFRLEGLQTGWDQVNTTNQFFEYKTEFF